MELFPESNYQISFFFLTWETEYKLTIVADFMNFKQGPIKNRLLVSVPLFAIGFLLTQIDFSIIWRYFAWANQTLATVVLWTISIYLLQERKFYWITLIPAVFMTAVIVTYLLLAPEGFSLSKDIAYPVGIIAACASFLSFFVYQKKYVAQPAFVTVKQKNPSK